MNALDFLDTLQFDDQLVLDENVNSVSTIEPNVFVLYRKWMLNSIFVLFVSFVVAVFPLICSQRSEWRTAKPARCRVTSGGGEPGLRSCRGLPARVTIAVVEVGPEP